MSCSTRQFKNREFHSDKTKKKTWATTGIPEKLGEGIGKGPGRYREDHDRMPGHAGQALIQPDIGFMSWFEWRICKGV